LISQLLQSKFTSHIYGFFCLALALALTDAAAFAYTIEGGVEHVERMPSVAPELRAGADFHEDKLTNGASNRWLKVPNWLAGTWLVKTETAVFQKDYKTGRSSNSQTTYKARHEFTYGYQKDLQGDIWHYIGVPYTSKTSLSEYDEFHKVSLKDFQTVTGNEVRFRTLMTVIRVNRSSDTIITSFQQESITSYRPVEDGVIELTSSTKSFDAAGNPRHETCNTATIKRVKPYIAVNEKDGKDLAALFKDFLVSRGLTNLLPQ